MDRTAVTPKRRTDRAHAGASSALLLPELLACTRNQLLILGGVRTVTLRRAEVRDRFVEQVLIHRAEDFIGQLKGAYLLSAQIYHVNVCHKISALLSAHR